MPLTKDTIERLLAVKKHILEEPRRFDMKFIRTPKSDAPCGTTCCIAGWLMKLAHPDAAPSRVWEGEFWELNAHAFGADEIADSFGLNQKLFYAYKWPTALYLAYNEAETPSEKAQVGADAIDAYIAADGKW